MPEGHSVHRLARQFDDVFGGERLAVSSPQGRFTDGASLVDGELLESAQAHGKHLFLRFGNGRYLHVHLGLYGAWDFGGDECFRGASSIGAPRRVGERELPSEESGESGETASASSSAEPPEPRGAVRARLVAEHGWADLRGASTCAVLDEDEMLAVVHRLGPDPLRPDPEGSAAEEFTRRVSSTRTAIGRVLMDQGVVAGIGNVYRAELLFRAGIDPATSGRAIGEDVLRALWHDAAALMADGVRDGRIITTAPEFWPQENALPPVDAAHYVYQRQGRGCRVCGEQVSMEEVSGRKLYWCRGCQNDVPTSAVRHVRSPRFDIGRRDSL